MDPRNRFCEERRDEIVLYIFGEMGPGAGEAFEAHLASCPGCRLEVDSLARTLRMVSEASTGPAAASFTNGDGISWEAEWTLLRRRLLTAETLASETIPFPPRSGARAWLARAAAVVLTAGLAFAAGYASRGRQAPGPAAPAATAAPPLAGASAGNYFDSLEDFSRDTHNFLRRTRMLLIEFANLGPDSDPEFFRAPSAGLLAEAAEYRRVADRMEARKLRDLLDEISGILTAISKMEPSSQAQVVGDVKATLDLTGLIATLEILDANIERDLRGRPHV
jgi:hypothetical protein